MEYSQLLLDVINMYAVKAEADDAVSKTAKAQTLAKQAGAEALLQGGLGQLKGVKFKHNRFQNCSVT